MPDGNKKRISQIVFDRKLDNRDTTRRHGKEHWLHLNVRDPGTRIGMQPPIGMDVGVWIGVVSTLIAVRGGLIFAANVLANLLSWAVPVLSHVLGGPLVLFPDPQLLLDLVIKGGLDLWSYKQDYAKALATVLQALAQACPALSAFSGIDMERDIISQGKSCVIEIPTINPPWIRLFIIDLLIAQILYGRIHRHQKMDCTDVIIYLDEADADLSVIASDAAFADMFSILAQLLRMGREYGILVVVGVGVLGNISRFVSSSFHDIFIFNVSGGEQSLEAQRILQLPPGAEQMCQSLKPGNCLFLENQGAWPHAVWAKVDYLAPDRSREPVEYDALPSIVPSRSLNEMPAVEDALKKEIDEYNRRKLERYRAKARTLGKHAASLHRTAILHPWVPVARLWETAGTVPSPAAQKTAQRQLEGLGLDKFDLLRAGKRNSLLIEPTEAGFRAERQEPPKRRSRGDIKHSHLAHWVGWRGERRGYKTVIEWTVPGTSHIADVAFLHDGVADLFEIVSTCAKNLLSHLEASFSAKEVATVTIVAGQKVALKAIKKNLEAQLVLAPYLDRIRYLPAEDLIKELWP
ncbi:MAG TPA: hypothetical protein VM537_27135 [Anaerolineae bacterium]|nr:hypothetical protein [Anaerolineae bacterium]